MSQRFLFRSFEAHNFRAFRDFKIPKFRRVNVIGGLNGSGKTTLLEALFCLSDWKNVGSLQKALLWRGLLADSQQTADFLFHLGDRQNRMQLKTVARDFTEELTAEYKSLPLGNDQQLNQVVNISDAKLVSVSNQKQDGFHVKVDFDGQNEIEYNAIFEGQAATIKILRQLMRPAPKCTFLNKQLLTNNPEENAERFTAALQAKLKGRMKLLLQMLSPDAQDILLMKIGGQTTIGAEISNETYVPIGLLGDGAQFLLTMGLAIAASKDGAVFFDEFDTAIHYSRLKVVWKALFDLAADFNCQIFAATHSRECIEAASEGASEANRDQDLQYIRLDKLESGIVATSYSIEDLRNAFSEGWEVR